MHHYIISGSSCTERRDAIAAQFAALGIEPNFFDALMADILPAEEIRDLAGEDTYLSPGEICCAASHLAVYRRFLDSSEKSVFIFEDDACMPAADKLSVFDKAKAFMESLDRPAVLALQTSRWKVGKKADLGGYAVHAALNLFRTHGYLINRRAAESITRIQTPIRFEIDAFKQYYWLGQCDLYCLDRDLVGISEIGERSLIWPQGRGGRDIWRVHDEAKRRTYAALLKEMPFGVRMKSRLRKIVKAVRFPFK